MTTAEPTSDAITRTPDALVERLFGATIGALELFGVYLGTKLGLYVALRDLGDANPHDLAAHAGIHPRYAQEWLEQQAVAGLLLADDAAKSAGDRRYSIPAGTVNALTNPADGMHVLPFADLIVGMAGTLPRVAEVYRAGEGLPFSAFGPDVRNGQAGINRPVFSADLIDSWLPAVPDIHAALQAGARVADIGCGAGWASIAIASAYPATQVTGFDLDAESIADARTNAAGAGSPATFVEADASTLAASGPFGFALILEALHDMSRPDLVLRAVHESLEDGASLVVADERVAPGFTAPGDEVERIMYGWSIGLCLVNAMDEQPSHAIGTPIRESTIRALAEEAGFASTEVLPIENDFFRFYRLRK